MRDILVFAIVILLLPTSIRRPFVGLLLFSWLAYMRPQDLCWGFVRGMRLSFFVAIAMLAGWWAYEQGRRPFARWDFRTVAMLGLGCIVTISYAGAQRHDEYTNSYFVEFVKILVIALFTTAQVDSRARLRVMFWTIALSLGFFGVKGGILGILSGGNPILRGPGGMLEDNNDFGLALVMNVPLLWYLGIDEQKRAWVKHGTRIAVLLTVVTILLTHSRGAFLALVMTSLWIAWRSGHLVRAVGVLAFLALLFPFVVPDAVLERLATIGDTKESSAHARLVAWGTALNMIAANPLLGVGLRNFQTRFVEFADVLAPGDETYVAHNSYLQIWAESGSFAFLIYLGLLFSVFLACRHVLRLRLGRPDLAWAGNYARMMEATTVGFLCGAFFLNRGHFDLIYHWLALTTALVLVTRMAWSAAPVAATGQVPGRARQITVRATARGRLSGRWWPGGATPAGAIATPGWR
ncbi:MAG: putative O-glycosylation ligase, exosortase A system-associated [Planctomycetota bacterium]